MGKNKIRAYFFLALTACIVGGCSSQSQPEEAKFELDHILIFVNDSSIENELKNGIFTFGDKLSTKHTNQGTYGHYFIFHNSYLELLYLEDSVVARKNEERFKSKYTERWRKHDRVCPFGFGLTLSPFDTAQTSFPLVPYTSLDSPKGEYYLMSEFNSHINQPLIYVSTPQNAYAKLDSLSQVDQMFDDNVREDFRNYLTHPSEIKKLTKVIITLPKDGGGNVEILRKLKGVEIDTGKTYGITLIFDNENQGKEVSLESTYSLNIKY